MARNQFIAALNSVGQSIWYDNLSRDVLNSGELARLIENGVSGLTSNPTIFKKAIADTKDYDQTIKELLAQGDDVEVLCEDLMIEDVQRAADLLRPVFDSAGGTDGFASLEVSPLLARDTAGTAAAAQRLWQRLNRPNVMIKVPATAEGLPAIKALLAAGINVNITLIFSLKVYAQVVEAYLSALEERLAKGASISSVASVASFFVSRVDAITEQELLSRSPNAAEPFIGKVGIENSRGAYRLFLESFGGERFAKLKAAGAQVQRPLWASTGTKNPAFSPVLYVEALAAQDTVNTVPPATLKALMKWTDVASRLPGESTDLLARLAEQGIDLEALLVKLEAQGVKSFADSYEELLSALSAKVRELSRPQ